MTQEEKFRIWSATDPTIAEVETFLNRLKDKTNCKTKLPLVYYKHKKKFEEYSFLPDCRAQLYGIKLSEGSMLCTQSITKQNFEEIEGWAQKTIEEQLHQDDYLMTVEARINQWVMKRYSNSFCALAANEDDIMLMLKNKDALLHTLEVLSAHGVNIPKIDWETLVWINEGEDYCQGFREKYDVKEYLENKGDILIFRDTELDIH
jgi:hypothetical protein